MLYDSKSRETIMKTLTKLAMFAISGALLMPVSAMAGDNCKNVDITVQNLTGSEIKVKKIKHYDFDKSKWRGNFNVANKVSNNYQKTYNKNLQFVKNDQTRIAVYYYNFQTGNSIWAYGSSFVCNKNDNVTVRIN